MGEKRRKIQIFRDLIAWQRAMELARATYKATAQMPGSEQFGLTNQMRRAAVSVPSNIAEGYARGSLQDYLRCLRIARGSLAELETQAELAVSLALLPANPGLTSLLNEVHLILQSLIKSLENTQGS